MKVTVCQLDNRPDSIESELEALAKHIDATGSEFLLLPEMCFHEWLAADRQPQRERWLAAVESHAAQILQLGRLGARAVIGTRPIVSDSGAFHNQAYLWTVQPRVLPVHEKYYLPDEAGYWEASWYQPGQLEFNTCQALDLINPATIYIAFRGSRKRQIKARLAAKAQGIRCAHGAGSGYSIGKSCNAELALSWAP